MIKNYSPHTNHENKSLSSCSSIEGGVASNEANYRDKNVDTQIMQKAKAKTRRQYFVFILRCIFLLSPLVSLAFFLRTLMRLDCVDTTNKMWMVLVVIFIYAYINKYYFCDFFEQLK